MRYVIDASVAIKWYVQDNDIIKMLNLRADFRHGVHEILAPDILPAECADRIVKAERQGAIDPGEADGACRDFAIIGPILHPSFPLLCRAADIALQTGLTASIGLYIALAEREQCQYVTAETKILRRKKTFPFIVAFSSIP